MKFGQMRETIFKSKQIHKSCKTKLNENKLRNNIDFPFVPKCLNIIY